MIIGIDASRANVKNKTGTEWYAFYIIEEIKKMADPQDQFILYSKKKLNGVLAKLPPNFTSKILRWPPKYLWTQLRLGFEMLIQKTDVLFVPAHTVPIICPKKTITTLHDVGFEEFASLYSKKEIGPDNWIVKKLLKIIIRVLSFGKYSTTELDYHRWSARLARKKASTIITVSNFSKQEIIKQLDIPEELIKVVYAAHGNAYHRIDDEIKINSILAKYTINKPYFLYIGRLETKKNVDGIVRGFSSFKERYPNQNYQLVLVGTPGYGFDKIRHIITNKNLTHDVVLPGWVENEDLPLLMNAATAFVFPSRYEGFGIPIIESMACGTPVITSDRGATKEIAGGAALLVNPNDSEAIARAFIQIMSDESLRTSLTQKGLERSTHFSWTKSTAEILHILKS